MQLYLISVYFVATMSVLVSEMGYGEQQRIRILSPLCYVAAVSHFCLFSSYNVRIGIRDGIRRAAEDKNIIAIVLCSCISLLSVL